MSGLGKKREYIFLFAGRSYVYISMYIYLYIRHPLRAHKCFNLKDGGYGCKDDDNKDYEEEEGIHILWKSF